MISAIEPSAKKRKQKEAAAQGDIQSKTGGGTRGRQSRTEGASADRRPSTAGGAETAEIADQRALNANLLRISRERANADRGLRPKKIHTGYVVVMSSEKEIRYKTGRNKLLTAKVWETVLQSPYSVDFTESQARQLIEEDLLARKNGLLADVGITMICSGSSYENLIETENWKEIKAAHNTLFSRQLRANYRVGYWEYIIQHTKPLGIVPADMRAGTKKW